MIYAVIVNYNGGIKLRNIVRQLKDDCPDIRVVVVDNASKDDSLHDVPVEFIIRNKKNMMYAHAANQGIRWALEDGADYVLLINFDTRIGSGLIQKLKGKQTGIAAPTIYYEQLCDYRDGLHKKPEIIWSKGGIADLKNGIIKHIRDEKI